jgi:hypothetical protein
MVAHSASSKRVFCRLNRGRPKACRSLVQSMVTTTAFSVSACAMTAVIRRSCGNCSIN